MRKQKDATKRVLRRTPKGFASGAQRLQERAMRNDRTVLCREVLEVLSGILEGRVQAEKAHAAEQQGHALHQAENGRRRKEDVGAPAPRTSRAPAA
jgi:hypothetical protein